MSDTVEQKVDLTREQMENWLTLEGWQAYKGGYTIRLYHPATGMAVLYRQCETHYYQHALHGCDDLCAITDMDYIQLAHCFERIYREP